MAMINFKKKPTLKNLKNRSISFQEQEVQFVRPSDSIHITVMMPNGNTQTPCD